MRRKALKSDGKPPRPPAAWNRRLLLAEQRLVDGHENEDAAADALEKIAPAARKEILVAVDVAEIGSQKIVCGHDYAPFNSVAACCMA